MSDATVLALIVAATFVLAGFITGIVGMGLPTVSMGRLSLVMAPASAANCAQTYFSAGFFTDMLLLGLYMLAKELLLK